MLSTGLSNTDPPPTELVTLLRALRLPPRTMSTVKVSRTFGAAGLTPAMTPPSINGSFTALPPKVDAVASEVLVKRNWKVMSSTGSPSFSMVVS